MNNIMPMNLTTQMKLKFLERHKLPKLKKNDILKNTYVYTHTYIKSPISIFKSGICC